MKMETKKSNAIICKITYKYVCVYKMKSKERERQKKGKIWNAET